MACARMFWCLLFTAIISFPGAAQDNRYMVFFKDKDGITETLAKPIEFLSEKAIQRRLRQSLSVTADDLPVSKAYVQGVRDAGVKTFFTTRWLNGVLVHGTPAAATAIEALPYVKSVEYVGPPARGSSGGRRNVGQRKSGNNLGIETENQLQMIGIDKMHQEDHKGKGVTIAIIDSGFPGVNVAGAFDHLFSEGRVQLNVSYDFAHNSADVFQYDDHGTEVLSVIAGYIPDAFSGGAFEATFQLYVAEEVPTEYRVEEYNWLFAAERADSAGVDIIHSSLGYYDFDDTSMNYSLSDMDGKTTVVSRAAQWAADRGIAVITSAGNEGNITSWKIVTAPADAKDVLAIGGVNSAGQKTGSSSIGPTADNRIKPDLAALGTGVKVVKSNGQVSTASGTSLSAPLVTSLVAGIMQRYPDLGSREVLTLLKQSASQAAKPDNLLGYGIPNFQAVVNFLEQKTQTDPVEIYPNPLIQDDDTLTISPKDPGIFDSCEVEIVSSQGEVLRRTSVKFDWLNRTFKTTLAGLASGIYYVRVISGKRKDTFKLVKLR